MFFVLFSWDKGMDFLCIYLYSIKESRHPVIMPIPACKQGELKGTDVNRLKYR